MLHKCLPALACAMALFAVHVDGKRTSAATTQAEVAKGAAPQPTTQGGPPSGPAGRRSRRRDALRTLALLYGAVGERTGAAFVPGHGRSRAPQHSETKTADAPRQSRTALGPENVGSGFFPNSQRDDDFGGRSGSYGDGVRGRSYDGDLGKAWTSTGDAPDAPWRSGKQSHPSDQKIMGLTVEESRNRDRGSYNSPDGTRYEFLASELGQAYSRGARPDGDDRGRPSGVGNPGAWKSGERLAATMGGGRGPRPEGDDFREGYSRPGAWQGRQRFAATMNDGRRGGSWEAPPDRMEYRGSQAEGYMRRVEPPLRRSTSEYRRDDDYMRGPPPVPSERSDNYGWRESADPYNGYQGRQGGPPDYRGLPPGEDWDRGSAPWDREGRGREMDYYDYGGPPGPEPYY